MGKHIRHINGKKSTCNHNQASKKIMNSKPNPLIPTCKDPRFDLIPSSLMNLTILMLNYEFIEGGGEDDE